MLWLTPAEGRGNFNKREMELLYYVGNHALEKVVQRRCGASLTGDIPESSRHNPIPCAPGWSCLSREVSPDDHTVVLPALPILILKIQPRWGNVLCYMLYWLTGSVRLWWFWGCPDELKQKQWNCIIYWWPIMQPSTEMVMESKEELPPSFLSLSLMCTS